jgi:hypothetical protein
MSAFRRAPARLEPTLGGFKSVAAADWAMGANDECSAWLQKPSPGVRNGRSILAVC